MQRSRNAATAPPYALAPRRRGLKANPIRRTSAVACRAREPHHAYGDASLYRLTNAFSKKFENHVHMVALYTVWYNFIRIHKTLKMSPGDGRWRVRNALVDGRSLREDGRCCAEAGSARSLQKVGRRNFKLNTTGWPDSWFSFSRVMPHLSPRLRVFVPDQRGFGDSEKPDSGYGIDDLAADAIAFLDAVSIERATFVGHSFGSFVARRIAIANPRRVARLVLIGTGVTAGTPAVLEARAALDDLPDPVPAGFALDFQASTAYLPLPELFFERIVAESLKLPARLWRGALDGLLAYDDVEQLSRITAPTLLMWGEQDALFPAQTRTVSSPRFQALGFLFIRRQGIARIGNDLNGSPPISRPSSARSHRTSVTLLGDPVGL